MTEVDVHKWNIELFGSKEEFKKEIEVLLEHSRTQMKSGGVRLNNGRFTLQKKRCIVAFWPLKRIRLYRSIMFGAEMLMRGLTGIAVHSPHEKHSNLRSGIFFKVLFERHSIPRRKGLQQRLCLKGCGIHLTLKNGCGSLLATWLGFPSCEAP
ncbi:hypothetical protein EDC96DRAFT_541018 [Choanephora cucurbitarum]|nr:hypothetical protein EDC96DRAFT_541018 [Choanephora cucurbitarum]